MELNMNDKELCPICGEGHVTDHVDQVESEYKGTTAMLPMHYQICDTCHSDFAGAAEGKKNKRAVLAFRKSVDGLLTGAEIVALRKQYRLTQDQAAKLFGGGPVAFSKYENDDVAHSEAMDTLLRLVLESPEAFWTLAQQKNMCAELSLKQPNAARRTFRTSKTNVIYIESWIDAPSKTHTAQTHQYAAYSLSTEPETKIWKQ